ncbi:MAG: Na+-transporting NADH:ubiquinone oxidoreductase, subunit NqrB [Bdellovibrionales bacterium]|nr:Na+-transporting NADH:ubiquinone oxidoreductase, subunit NqrB [Bdellovibrionales bacterium]
MDPRFYQISFLASFLVLGGVFRDFRLGWLQVFVVIASGTLTQSLAILKFRLSWTTLRSALISSLGLLMLFRTQSYMLLGAASSLAILSKFVFRYRGKHFFNPTNFALCFFLLTSSAVWISPAQWGEEFLVFAWMGLLGILVTHRALRNDISYSFLGWYLLFLFIRVLYLGQPYTVFFHQLKSGSLILFAFFMISDPKSTPDNRWGRIVFAGAVAALTYVIKFQLYNPNALVLALFFLSPLTPLIDKLLPAKRFEWPTKTGEEKNDASNFYNNSYSWISSVGVLRFLCRQSR